MRYLLLILFITLSQIDAAWLVKDRVTADTSVSHCATALEVYDERLYLYIPSSASWVEETKDYTIYEGFEYDTVLDKCIASASETLSLGLTDAQFSFLMALTAVLFFTLVFYAITTLFTRS